MATQACHQQLQRKSVKTGVRSRRPLPLCFNSTMPENLRQLQETTYTLTSKPEMVSWQYGRGPLIVFDNNYNTSTASLQRLCSKACCVGALENKASSACRWSVPERVSADGGQARGCAWPGEASTLIGQRSTCLLEPAFNLGLRHRYYVAFSGP